MQIVFILAAFVQISFWIAMRSTFRNRESDDQGDRDDPARAAKFVSVIVAARNEDVNIEALLRCLRMQTYRDFEAIVVDDGSTDRTAEHIQNASEHDSRFRYLANDSEIPGKKAALSIAIEASTHSLLIFTDADCRPGPDWIAAHVRAQNDFPCVVVGYGPYTAQPTALNRLIRFETMTSAAMAATAIAAGYPYTAVGRNISYPRSVFDGIGGHTKTAHLLSGDDDLFVQQVHRQGLARVRFLHNASSFVPSDPPATLRGWLRQKRRHLGASSAYTPVAKTGLLIVHASAMLCWLAPLFIGLIGFGILAVKLLAQWITVHRVTKVLHESGLTWPMPALDAFYNAYLAVVTPVSWIFTKKSW